MRDLYTFQEVVTQSKQKDEVQPQHVELLPQEPKFPFQCAPSQVPKKKKTINIT
jgi:hypothetical protein